MNPPRFILETNIAQKGAVGVGCVSWLISRPSMARLNLILPVKPFGSFPHCISKKYQLHISDIPYPPPNKKKLPTFFFKATASKIHFCSTNCKGRWTSSFGNHPSAARSVTCRSRRPCAAVSPRRAKLAAARCKAAAPSWDCQEERTFNERNTPGVEEKHVFFLGLNHLH